MRNLVVCCDGTWNSADQRENGVPIPTNVVRLYNAVAEANTAGVAQLKYYHPGVGTQPGLLAFGQRVAEGVTGAGLDRNIMSAYHWLCETYLPGDRIYAFGFSRGAYTVRSLSGLVGSCGLLDFRDLDAKECWDRVNHVYEHGYKRRGLAGQQNRDDWTQRGWRFHESAANNYAIPIELLGVWDTVGSLGIPDSEALLNIFDAVGEHNFHDVKLNEQVRNARHAVAMDEIRESFQPTLWEGPNNKRQKQVWFPGVHADVGGGYRETGLSDAALKWMIDEARKLELGFNEVMLDGKRKQVVPNPLDVLHDSFVNVFKYFPSMPRSIPDMDDPACKALFHQSAFARKDCPPISDAPYRATVPKLAVGESRSFRIFARNPWNPTGLYLEANATYEFRASGEWLDKSIACGPDGTNDGKFQKGELFQLVASGFGELEEAFKKITGNPRANFKFTKRHERLDGKYVPWFCLIGAIANGGGCSPKGGLEEHEIFRIGSEASRKVERGGGYLYAFANDAWNFYDNNAGSVQLIVTRTG